MNRVIKFIDDTQKKEQPFFLYYALHQPHVPRVPSERFRGATELGPRGDVIVEMAGVSANCTKSCSGWVFWKIR